MSPLARLCVTVCAVALAFGAYAKSATEVFESVSNSVVVVYGIDSNGEHKSMGSGVVLAAGEVVTNYHVVKDFAALVVKYRDREYPAQIKNADSDRDVCSLTVPDLNAPVAVLGSSKTLKVGQRVYAIGAPQGLELTFSEGIISSLREVEGGHYIQTSAPISPGSSGGGLFDEGGRLIGLPTFFLNDGQQLNFAVPVEWIEKLPPVPVRVAGTEAILIVPEEPRKRATTPPPAVAPDAPPTPSVAPSLKTTSVGRVEIKVPDSETTLSFADDATDGEIADYLGVNYAKEFPVYGRRVEYKDAMDVERAKGKLLAAKANRDYSLWALSELPGTNVPFVALEALKWASATIFGRTQTGSDWLNKARELTEKQDWPELMMHAAKWTDARPNDAESWRYLGVAYANSGQTVKSIDAYQQALRINPDDADAWYDLGVAYRDSGEWAKAIEACRQALRVNPDDADAWNNLGATYLNSSPAETAKAIEAFEQAVQLKPNFANPWRGLGIAYSDSGQTAKAIDAYQRAVRLKPDDASTWYSLGIIYKHDGQSSKVMDSYRHLKTIDPKLAEIFFKEVALPK